MMTSPPFAPRPERRLVLAAGELPAAVLRSLVTWASAKSIDVVQGVEADLSVTHLRAAPPTLIVVWGDDSPERMKRTIQGLKADGRLQTIPVIAVLSTRPAAPWLDAGADEVLSSALEPTEVDARLTAALRRSHRDLQVNPSTRLAGGDAIADAISGRIESGLLFAACYADLDHFKEFNDRYGYAMGDQVIRNVAQLLDDVVLRTSGPDGFVGHIGGDDFLFLVPLERTTETCELLVRAADDLLPRRYTAHDRQAGYFFGKDRRGRLDRVPLMTLSIGVVTNARRRFTSAAQVSDLATEMKTYAKTLPGSVWAMDRRSDSESIALPEEKLQ